MPKPDVAPLLLSEITKALQTIAAAPRERLLIPVLVR